jgi:hypothetical protein
MKIKYQLRAQAFTIYGCLVGVIVLSMYLIRFIGLNSGVDSLYDEGYLLLKLWEARNNTGSHGGSQWSVMVYKLLGSNLSADLMFLRLSELILQLSSVVFVLISIYKIILHKINTEKSEIILFFSLVLLLLFPTFGSLFLYYNPIQQSLFNLIISNVILFKTAKISTKYLLLFLTGIISFFSYLVILPSGVVVTLLFLFYIFSINDFNIRITIRQYLIFLVGIIIAAIFYHFFINNLMQVYGEMKEVANTITKTNRGYDVFSFAIKYFVYFKAILLSIIPLLFATLAVFFIYKYHKSSSVFLFIILLILINKFWPWNKAMYSTLIILPTLFTMGLYFFLQKRQKSTIITILFLFLFPFIGLLGTNVFYGGKIVWFFISWAIIPIIVLNSDTESDFMQKHKQLMLIFISILYLFLPLKSLFSKSNNLFYFNKYENISNIKISESQFNYFNRVDSILSQYNFEPNKHYMFATQLDHMTIFVFNAKPNSTYFQPMDFVVDSKKFDLKRPEFIFLTKYDLDIAEEQLMSLNWKFPEAYNQYYIGTPETYNTGYSTERWLFCLKELKKF